MVIATRTLDSVKDERIQRQHTRRRGQMPDGPDPGRRHFPFTMVAFVIGRPASVRALEAALRGDKTIFLATQHDATVDEPSVDQIYSVGTLARITHNLRLPDGKIKVMVEGIERARSVRVEDDGEYWLATLRKAPQISGAALAIEFADRPRRLARRPIRAPVNRTEQS